MNVDRCSKADFLEIVDNLTAFWGSERAAAAHHPMVIEEFGETAFVVRENGEICGYLFGFFDQTGSRGIARELYAHAEELARARGATALKAITSLSNAGSIAFHGALGFKQLGDGEQAGIRYVPSYFSRTRNMVVLWKEL